MTFLRPEAFALLLFAPLVVLALRWTLVDLSRSQQRLSAGLRVVLLALVVVALARPSTQEDSRRVATVVVVDVSASMSDRQLAAAGRIVEEVRQAKRRDDVVKLVTFGARPELVELGDEETFDPRALRRHHADGTNLAAALRLAYGLYPPGTLRRALIVSDGNETEGDFASEAEAARRRGVRVFYRSVAREHADEVLVRSLALPPEVKVGAPFELVAEVESTRAERVTMTLYRDDFIYPLDGKKVVELAPGANQIKWKAEVAQGGFATWKAVVSPAPRSPFYNRVAGNNSAVASVAALGRPRVLYVEGATSAASYLEAALRRESIDVETRGAYGLPKNARDLAAYDLVILSDVPAAFVGPAQMEALESYVRDLGGGFIMIGGENSFGAGGYTGSRLEKLLPVRFDVERKRDQPNLALLLVIDRSGSMTGDKLELAKDAAKATAELLGPDDLLGVIAFDSQPTAIVHLQRAANRVRIGSDIARLSAGGGTNILPALKEAYATLNPARARLKHVILLTDGQASYEGIRELCDEMAEHKVTISAVGVGAEADKTLLTMIAERGGGRFYFTQSAENIPKIFTKETTEVAKNALVEEAVRVRVQKYAQLLDGVGIESAPPLGGYVETKPKPLSDVILTSDRGEPILARWRVGLGQAAAFTSDAKNRWAARWLGWPGYAKLWAHLVRSTMRGNQSASGRSFELSADVDPPRAHVVVDAVGADDKFVSGLDSTLEVARSDRPSEKRELALAETAPGRYEATFTMDGYGAFLLRALHRQAGEVVAESRGALSSPYPREYLALPPDEALLLRVAAATGGRADPEAAALFSPMGEKVRAYRERWPVFLWLAALFLLLDVAARRIRL